MIVKYFHLPYMLFSVEMSGFEKVTILNSAKKYDYVHNKNQYQMNGRNARH